MANQSHFRTVVKRVSLYFAVLCGTAWILKFCLFERKAENSIQDTTVTLANENAVATTTKDAQGYVEFPRISLSEPISDQVRLFDGDRVEILWYDTAPTRIRFGPEWQQCQKGRKYTVIRVPGNPIVPEVEGPTKVLSIQVEYTTELDKPRDLGKYLAK